MSIRGGEGEGEGVTKRPFGRGITGTKYKGNIASNWEEGLEELCYWLL